MLSVPAFVIEWQRLLDPSRMVAGRGAGYHTAPTVLVPGAPDIPDNAPEGSVSIEFPVSASCWLRAPERATLERPVIIEREPKGKAKNGAVIVMDAASAYMAIPPTENFYFGAKVAASHEVALLRIIPGRKQSGKDDPKTTIVVTFMPNEGEPRP